MAKTHKTTRGLRRYIDSIPAKAERAVLSAAERLKDGVENTVPVDEGDLKASLTARLVEREGDTYRAEITAGEGLPDGRAAFTNYGTTHSPAQLWWEGGLADVLADARSALRDEMKD